MRATILIGVFGGTLAMAGCASTEDVTKTAIESQPKMAAAETVRVTATVEAVDKENRILTLRSPGGELRTMTVDPAVKNFDQIQRGDRVTAEYMESIAVYIEAPGMVSKDETASVTATMPPGSRPSGAVIETVQRRATVEAIDHETRIVTLRGQDGSLRTIKVPPRLGSLDKISKGDPIVVRFTQTVAVGVAKAAP
jgi:hypothetical protein